MDMSDNLIDTGIEDVYHMSIQHESIFKCMYENGASEFMLNAIFESRSVNPSYGDNISTAVLIAYEELDVGMVDILTAILYVFADYERDSHMSILIRTLSDDIITIYRQEASELYASIEKPNDCDMDFMSVIVDSE